MQKNVLGMDWLNLFVPDFFVHLKQCLVYDTLPICGILIIIYIIMF